jgi:hypothetical protein
MTTRPFRPSRERESASSTEPAQVVQKLVTKQAGPLTRKAIELAMKGDASCLRYCLDQIPRRRAPDFKLPPIRTRFDVIEATRALIGAVNDGEVTIEEGLQLAGLLDRCAHAMRTVGAM